MGKPSQQKGRRAELELSKILTGYGFDVRPGEPVSFGKEPDLVGLPHIHIESKRREAVNIAAALRQAKADSERFGDGAPAVFCRGNREKWRVVMELDEWMILYQWALSGGFGRSNEQEGIYDTP